MFSGTSDRSSEGSLLEFSETTPEVLRNFSRTLEELLLAFSDTSSEVLRDLSGRFQRLLQEFSDTSSKSWAILIILLLLLLPWLWMKTCSTPHTQSLNFFSLVWPWPSSDIDINKICWILWSTHWKLWRGLKWETTTEPKPGLYITTRSSPTV